MKQHEEKYYAQVKKLGLRPSNVPTVYIGSDGMPYNVPDSKGRTPEQLEEIISKLKANLRVGSRDD